jgi:hypothetical protein
VVVLAMFLAQAQGARSDLRVHWAGVAATGRAPKGLSQKMVTQLGISVQPLGLRLGPGGSNLDASARCDFARAGSASCMVEVRDRSAQRHAEHRADIPYRDVDDFAQTLSLMVVDALVVDLRVVDPGAAPPPPPVEEPPPAPTPSKDATPPKVDGDATPTRTPEPPPPAPPEKKSPEVARQEEHRIVRAAPSPPPRAIVATAPAERSPARLALSVGPTLALDTADAPMLYGVDARLVWSRGPFELGGAVALAGATQSEAGYDLSFLRVAVGPRVGLLLRSGRWIADVSAGPALLMLRTSAQPGETHTLEAFAGVVGTSGQVAISQSLGLQLGVDALLPASRERVVVGQSAVAEFGLVSVGISLALLYQM